MPLPEQKPVKILDPSKPQEVAYAIPFWLRDEQVRASCVRAVPRIQAIEKRPAGERIAIVCYGPSLNETWETIREFQWVMSCSGAHRFLIDRGIVPTWHVEVDPRPHKPLLIGEPHKDVEYLIASTCHEAMWKHLEGFNVKLWHVFDPKEEGFRALPAGEWALTGGCSVGLRAMTVARFFGFWQQEIFGMDGCEGPSGKHAAAHPNQPKDYSICDYGGMTYRTTPAMLEAARGTFHELDQMPDVVATFHGDGLVQAMARDYKPRPVPPKKAAIGYAKPELISTEYRGLNEQLHRENLAYGVGGGKHAPTVLKLIETTKTRSVLDYGCGKGYLGKALAEHGVPIWEYDPAIPGKQESPRPADLVICTDVLEHVEPERILYVLDDLRRCIRQVGYFTIHTGPAQKKLADGRNTHLIQRNEAWWRKKLGKFFNVAKIFVVGQELHIVVAPRPAQEKRQWPAEQGQPIP